MSNYESLFWFKSQPIYENGEYMGTAPGYYYVSTSPREDERCRNAGGKISDDWEDYNRYQYFADGGDY